MPYPIEFKNTLVALLSLQNRRMLSAHLEIVSLGRFLATELIRA